MSLGTVLVVEDDAAIRRGLSDALRFSNYTVFEAADGRDGLDMALSIDCDIILLDIMMPRMDGLEMLAELRKARSNVPVIFLTARGEETDRVQGLRLGADDYVVKPFGVDELVARVEAVLRRSAERPTGLGTLVIAGRAIDFERREVRLPGGEVRPISQREAEVLAFLAQNPTRAVSRDELLQKVWGLDPRGVHTRTVDMAVARLRETLDDDPSRSQVVVTVRGKGYMLGQVDGAPEGAS